MTDAIRGYTGTQKAALVLMQMGRERAADVLRLLSEDVAEELATQIARLPAVDDSVAEAALREFVERAGAPAATRGGLEAAEQLMAATFGDDKAAALVTRLEISRPFEFLDSADPAVIATLVAEEMPETIAQILIQLSTATSSGVLARLDGDLRVRVAQAIATAGTAQPEAVGLLADTIRRQVRTSSKSKERREAAGGVQPLVDILNRSEPETERTILAELEERDPVLAAEVRSRMFGFDDLVDLEPRDVQQVLRGIDAGVIALALKGASEATAEVVLANMSDRNREAVATEQGYLGAVRRSQVEGARGVITSVARQLQADGEISRKSDAAEEPEEELVE